MSRDAAVAVGNGEPRPEPDPGDIRAAELWRLHGLLGGGFEIRVRSARKVLLSLRGRPGACVLGLDPRLLIGPDCSVLIAKWALGRGRKGVDPRLRQHLREIARKSHDEQVVDPAIAALPTLGRPDPVVKPAVEPPHGNGIQAEKPGQRQSRSRPTRSGRRGDQGGSIDLERALADIHARWFSDLPLPSITWSRRTAGQVAGIRFGSYRRRTASISLHPRMDRPWIARVFLEHVLFHELCHHRQACEPIRHERIHSRRFRLWERSFPGHASAMAWERAALHAILADQPPPWWSSAT